MVKIKIHAGGAWEGHTFYNVEHPLNPEIRLSTSNLHDVIRFCDQHQLLMDDHFVELVKKHLIFEEGKGYRISPEHLDDSAIITSAGKYLKNVFGSEGYY